MKPRHLLTAVALLPTGAVIAAAAVACGPRAPSATPPLTDATTSFGSKTFGSLPLGDGPPLTYRIDCSDDADCRIASVAVDCCGTGRALGVRASDKRRLEKAARERLPHAGTCECLAGPTVLDDNSTESEPGDGVVSCREARCGTHSARSDAASAGSLKEFWVALDDAVVLASQIDESWLSEEKREVLRLLRQQREDPSLELDVPEDTPLTESDVTLPENLREWRGKTLAVWSTDDISAGRAGSVKTESRSSVRTPGAPCLPTVTDVRIRSVAEESFESVRSVWADSLAGVVVVGRFSSPCPGALFATTSPNVRLHAPMKPSPELALLGKSAFLDDEERRGCAEPTLQSSLFVSPKGQQLLIVTGFDAEKESGFSAFFEATPAETGLRFLTSTNQDLTPQVALDIDGGGRLELVLGPDGLENARHLFFSASGSLVEALSSPNFQCPG